MHSSRPEFAIVGAGALGSILGAHLARAGHSVVLLARERRAQQILQAGVKITGLADWTQPVPVLSDAGQFRGAEVLIVATKTNGTGAALDSVRGCSVDVALSVQNGLQKNDQLADCFGADRVLGAVADISGELRPSGEVLFTRNELLCVGELRGSPHTRALSIAGRLAGAGICAKAMPDIENLEWSKFAAWAGLMVLAVTTRLSTPVFLSEPATALVLARVVREIGDLASRYGIEMSDQSTLPVRTICTSSESDAVSLIMATGAKLRIQAPNHRMSALQDLEAGRALEIEATLGEASRKAGRAGLRLPLLAAFCSLVTGIDRLRSGPSAADVAV